MFNLSYQDLNDIIPEGKYEAAITRAAEDHGCIVINCEIRKDVQQDCAGRTLTHWMYKLREPKELDAAVGGYSFSQVMRIAKAAALPEGKNYQSLGEMLADLAGKAVQLELYHELYNGKKYLKVKYWNPSEVGPLTYVPEPPQPRQTAGAANTAKNTAPAQNTQSGGIPGSALPWN